MQALDSLYYAQFTLSTQLIKLKYPLIPPPSPSTQAATQFLRNLAPQFIPYHIES